MPPKRKKSDEESSARKKADVGKIEDAEIDTVYRGMHEKSTDLAARSDGSESLHNKDEEMIKSEENKDNMESVKNGLKLEIGHSNGSLDSFDTLESSLYLETIDRKRLDFDFEKLCSVSLSSVNVYACLTCGKYFQGRGKKSFAYIHSVDSDHHVFINLGTKKIYVLPEGYQVTNSSLDDIKFVLDPLYDSKYVLSIDKTPQDGFDLDHRPYRPGFVGLNNIKQNSYANVVIQALAHISPLRNFLMLENFAQSPELAKRFSTLVKKIWNPRAFQAHVSPHELLQYVSSASNKKFTATEAKDPFDFLLYLLHELHLSFGGSKKSKSSILHEIIQGKIRIESQALVAQQAEDARLKFSGKSIETSVRPFLFLALELPTGPLFQRESEQDAISQVHLTNLLSKYDGTTTHELPGDRRRYKIIEAPQVLLLHIKRFNKMSLVERHNPTVVNFNVNNLDMAPYVDGAQSPMYYNLIANIIYDEEKAADVDLGNRQRWKVQVLDKSRLEWKEIEDLVVESVPKELIFLRESYIQVWERLESMTL